MNEFDLESSSERPSANRFLTVWFVLAALIYLVPTLDLDLFAHIELGKIQLAHSNLIHGEPFSFIIGAKQIDNQNWLAQIAFAIADRIGGYTAVHIFYALVIAAAFIVPSCGSCAILPLVALLFAFTASITNLAPRAQGFGFLCFAIFYLIARTKLSWPPFKLLFVTAILCVLWQNLHPSVLLGAILSAVLLAASVLTHKGDWPKHLLMGITAFLAQFLTPSGFRAFEIAAVNKYISRDVLAVSEWLPSCNPAVRSAALPMLSLLGFSIIMAICSLTKNREKSCRAAQITDLLLFMAFSALALYAARFIVFWSIIMLPIWTRWLTAFFPALSKRRMTVHAIAPVVAAMIAVAVFCSPSSITAELPQAAVQKLKEKLPDGRIYNYREWGGYLAYNGYPRWQILADGRLYLYPERFWRDYNAEASGAVPLEEIIRNDKPDAFFLHSGFDHGLIGLLEFEQGWERVYSEGDAVVYVRRAASQGIMTAQ